MRDHAQRIGRLMLFLFSAVLLLFLILLVVLLIWSHPGKPRPFLDAQGNPLPGSIAEKVFVNINGLDQGMFIKSSDSTHPVLLHLHGGMPEYFLTQSHPVRLEEFFTVVWWEQRGTGLSWSSSLSPETFSTEHSLADIFELTDYLRRRFHQEKIFLMAHSGGSFPGIQAAARRPHLYHAYIGEAQIVHQRRSETRSYEYMLKRYREEGTASMVRKLEAAPVTLSGGVPDAYLAVRDEAMHGLGVGTTRDMRSVLTGVFLPSLRFPEYTLAEKIRLWRGKMRSGVSVLWREIMATDLNTTVTKLDLPVYFLHGQYDYTLSYDEAQAYFHHLKIPAGGFYSFEHSAHSPVFEEPDRALKILLEDVLRGRSDLADP